MAAEASEPQSSGTGVAFSCLVGGLFATLMVVVPRTWFVTERFTYPKGLLFHAAARLIT